MRRPPVKRRQPKAIGFANGRVVTAVAPAAAAAVAAVAAVAVALVAAVAVHRDCPVAAAASPLLTQVPQPTDAAAAQLRRVQMPSVKLDLLRLPRLHHTHSAHHTTHCTAHCTAHCTTAHRTQ